MIIRFHKGRDVDVLTCIRADGSTTWNRLGPRDLPIAHDLIHYAVETTLGWRDAFFGLVESGWDIATFTQPGAARLLPIHAVQAEFIVGLLQTELLGGPSHEKTFLATLAQACANGKIPPPAVNHIQLQQIREKVSGLLGRWRELPEDQSIELPF